MTTSHRILVFAIAASMCLVLSPAMSSAAEPQIGGASDKKSFNTVTSFQTPQTHNGVISNGWLLNAYSRSREKCRVVISARMQLEVLSTQSASIGRDLRFGSVCRRTDSRLLQSINEATSLHDP